MSTVILRFFYILQKSVSTAFMVRFVFMSEFGSYFVFQNLLYSCPTVRFLCVICRVLFSLKCIVLSFCFYWNTSLFAATRSLKSREFEHQIIKLKLSNLQCSSGNKSTASWRFSTKFQGVYMEGSRSPIPDRLQTLALRQSTSN
jgi:hypothetical protein